MSCVWVAERQKPVNNHVVSLSAIKEAGLQITAGQRTMSGQK